MKYETGLEFGRNAALINEAYEKMLRGKSICESSAFATSLGPEPKPGDADYIDDEDFEANKVNLRKRREARGEAPKDDGSNAIDTATDEIDTTADANTEIDDTEEEEFDDSLPEDNFYENIIEANPDTFNDESYDMEALKTNKKEILNKALVYMGKGYNPIESVEKALEEIDGCECKNCGATDIDDASDSDETIVDDETNESYDAEDYGDIYIGRTDDYYSEEDDGGVFQKPMWTWGETQDDTDFAAEGPIYKLTEEGKEDFFEWKDSYEVGYDLNMGKSRRPEGAEEEWESLTNPENGLSEKVI